jgi:type II restriction/modification system DNA methylase subunit YeeA
MLNESTPAQADPLGEKFCFERGARKTGGGDGWADVWKKGFFAWEYKGKHKDLDVAYAQLQRYAIALENPPLLVVSDMARIEIHTNFTNTVHEKHVIPITEIGAEHNLRILRYTFKDPDKLKPGRTTTAITEDAALQFASLANVLRDRGGEPLRVAHFLNRILFCLFAQDAKLLPNNVVRQLLETGLRRPEQANQMLTTLFSTMKKGGIFGTHFIEWFNGNLFDSNDAIPLEAADIKELLAVAGLDWSAIEPSIFGTLFERGLDPTKRAQIGAHYTDAQSIRRIVTPAVIEPLEEKWRVSRLEIKDALDKADRIGDRAAAAKWREQAQMVFNDFLRVLAEFRVLDPACGSGNFLYIALQELKNLEHRVTLEAEQLGLEALRMHVGVQCVHGIDLNMYAAELARVTVWIGEIQWMLSHGIEPSKRPILKPLDTIECRDAIMNCEGTEPDWPKADAIIGNPPFLGDKKMLAKLGDSYTCRLRNIYAKRVPGGADLCCYWFEKARAAIVAGKATTCGLVATNSIRGGRNRVVLDRISESGTITCAWSDEEWVNEGASVRVSLVCFGRKDTRSTHLLDGLQVEQIFSNLTGHFDSSEPSDVTKAAAIPDNADVCFEGIKKYGAFDIPGETAREWLKTAGNPNGRPNSDVLRPWLNAMDVMRRPSDTWVIDFGSMSMEEAARYERPFAHVAKFVRPERAKDRNTRTRDTWWLFERPRVALRRRLNGLTRYIVTPVVAKHRVFVWLSTAALPSNLLDAIVRDDDLSFGILHSRFHELWSLRLCTWLGVGNDPRYTPTTTFESFPFPECLALNRPVVALATDTTQLVSAAAKSLNEMRESWLNPSELAYLMPEVLREYPDRIIAHPGREADLKKRTLTNLYNSRPAWLENAHLELDKAVALAYGWNDYTATMPDDEIISRLLKLNLERAPDLFASSSQQITVRELNKKDHGEVRNPKLAPNGTSMAVLERRLAVVCTLVNRLADEPNFGRTKMAKLFYLADVTQDLDIDTNYYRQAAGPLDAVALYDEETGLEALAVKNRYLSVEKNLKKITYRRGPDLEKALENARTVLGKSRSAINKLIDLFRPLDTDQCEIVATLYACWNDRIIDKKDVSDKSIVEEFLTAWHDRKRRFPAARLLKALAWMRKSCLVPTGRGGHTKTTQKARSYQLRRPGP